MAKTKKEDAIEFIDKDQIAKEIKKEAKDELLEEVKRKIDYESKKSLENAEKKIYKYKNFAIFKRDILILLFLGVIIFETKILYDNDLLFKESKKNDAPVVDKVENNNKEDEEKPEVVKDLAWYKENYGYLYTNIKTNLEDTYYLYKKSIKVDEIDNTVKLNMAYQLLDDKKVEGSVISIEGNKLKDAYKKIFGDIEFKAENFKDNCIQFIYNKDTNTYMAIDTTCKSTNDSLVTDITNIFEKDNTLVIEVVAGILKDKKLSNIDGVKIKDNYNNNIDEVKDKLSKYEFIYEKQENEYYLKEIKKK